MSQSYDISKKPPQAVELEEAVIGAILLEQEAMDVVSEILSERSFYAEKNGRIFSAALRIRKRNEPVDLLTIVQELKASKELESIGGAYYVSQLTNKVASSANVETHARIIAQHFIRREIIRIASDSIRNAYDDGIVDVFSTLDEMQNKLYSVERTFTGGKKVELLRDLIPQERDLHFQNVQRAMNSEVLGVTTGFRKLDLMTSGWQPEQLVIVAARPAMGKTALMLAMAKAAALSGIAVAIASIEMAALQLVRRMVQAESEVNSVGYRNGKLSDIEERQLEIARGRLETLGIYIDDTPAISISEWRTKARRLAKKGVKVFFVDYLQLMTTGEENRSHGRNREQEISMISATLKRTARELKVTVIALAQLSRAVESRGGDKRPQLSDLRESGAIEQDADIVIFPHRPEYYGITQDAEGNSTHGVAQLIVAKHRNGPTDDVNVMFIDRLTKFVDPDRVHTIQNNTAALNPNNEFLTNTPARL